MGNEIEPEYREFVREQEIQRGVEQLIYDSGWIYNKPNTTVQGLAGQIISYLRKVDSSKQTITEDKK